jgi:hypothetical protein
MNGKPQTQVALNGSARKFRGTYNHGKTEVEIKEMAEKFATKLPADKYSPAEIQGYLLKHKTDPEGALADVETWIAEREKSKSQH